MGLTSNFILRTPDAFIFSLPKILVVHRQLEEIKKSNQNRQGCLYERSVKIPAEVGNMDAIVCQKGLKYAETQRAQKNCVSLMQNLVELVTTRNRVYETK